MQNYTGYKRWGSLKWVFFADNFLFNYAYLTRCEKKIGIKKHESSVPLTGMSLIHVNIFFRYKKKII